MPLLQTLGRGWHIIHDFKKKSDDSNGAGVKKSIWIAKKGLKNVSIYNADGSEREWTSQNRKMSIMMFAQVCHQTFLTKHSFWITFLANGILCAYLGSYQVSVLTSKNISNVFNSNSGLWWMPLCSMGPGSAVIRRSEYVWLHDRGGTPMTWMDLLLWRIQQAEMATMVKGEGSMVGGQVMRMGEVRTCVLYGQSESCV